MVADCRQRLLGICLAVASTFFYAGMFLAIQWGKTTPFDFQMFRSLMLALVFLVPKLCQEKPQLMPKDQKLKVGSQFSTLSAR